MNLLEWNDAELTLYRDGEAVYRQPAIAHLSTERNLFGLDALRLARLHPQQANQQYLARLNADPLAVPGQGAANHADLVYLHLLELRSCLDSGAQSASGHLAPDASRTARTDGSPGKRRGVRLPWQNRRSGDSHEMRRRATSSPVPATTNDRPEPAANRQVPGQRLIAAVPGSLTRDQLGVLLGITQEAGIDVGGFVDSAVLMASAAPLPEHAWLLDLHLTRACLTELTAGDEVARTSVQEIPGCGLMSCLDGWANLLADRFVQDTRFDPMHAADTEQQLYDQLYDWTQHSRNGTQAEGDFVAEVRHGGHERRVQVPGPALRRKLMQRFQQITQKVPPEARILVAPRSAALPGLLPGLTELGLQAEGLPANSLEHGFERHAGTIGAGELTLVSRLPCVTVEIPKKAATRPMATHVLFESRAWPLHDNPFGLPDTGHAGDTVHKDGRSFALIAVESGFRT